MPLRLPPFGLVTLGVSGGPPAPPEMPAAPPAQTRRLTSRRNPPRARFYLKPEFSLGSREPPIPRPRVERLTRGGERAFVTEPLPAALRLGGRARATLFIATRSASPPPGTAHIRVQLEALDGNRVLAEGTGVADMTRCVSRVETFLAPLCAVAVPITLPVAPGARVEAGERLVARISLEGTTGQLPRLHLLYDSTHYDSRLEVPVEDLLTVAAVREDRQSARIDVEVEDRLGSNDVLDAAVLLRPHTGPPRQDFLPLAFQRDLTPTRSLWVTEQTVAPRAAVLDATVIVRNVARRTARAYTTVGPHAEARHEGTGPLTSRKAKGPVPLSPTARAPQGAFGQISLP